MLQPLNGIPTGFIETEMMFIITHKYKKTIQNIKIFFWICLIF